MRRKDRKKRPTLKKSRIVWLALMSVVIVLTIAGVSYAWIAQNAAMATLMKILPPDSITIVPVKADGEGFVELDLLDLDYQEGDVKDEDGRIHVFRPICIKSTSPVHRLEIVHTTNLKSLTFNIYPATKTIVDGNIGLIQDATLLSGEYKNQDSDNLAKRETLENYNNTADVADAHAYPLYWVAVDCYNNDIYQTSGGRLVTSYVEESLDPETGELKDYYCTYYYLEISWLEETKETDLFYIIAQNVAQ